MKTFSLLLILVTSISSTVFAQEMKPILRLQDVSGKKVVQVIELLANDIDPNSSSVDDVYRLEIDGKEVAIPKNLTYMLESLRRQVSYDYMTGGIQDTNPTGPVCMLYAPANGSLLQVNYLTYKDWSIVGSEMKTVYSEADNCRFMTDIKPAKAESEKAAAQIMSILRTIRSIVLQ